MKTEDQVIIEHTRNWFSDSSWSIEKFATELLVPMLEAANIMQPEDIKTADQLISWRKKKAVHVGRVLKFAVPFPLSWKWFWLRCLPEGVRDACESDLMALSGKLNVSLPLIHHHTQTASEAHIDRVMREFSEFIASSKPAQDGRYDQSDNPEEADLLIDEALDVIAVLIREVVAIQAGTGCRGQRRNLADTITLIKVGEQ